MKKYVITYYHGQDSRGDDVPIAVCDSEKMANDVKRQLKAGASHYEFKVSRVVFSNDIKDLINAYNQEANDNVEFRKSKASKFYKAAVSRTMGRRR